MGWQSAVFCLVGTTVTVDRTLLTRTIFGGRDYAQIYSNIAITAVANTMTGGGRGALGGVNNFRAIFVVGIAFLFLLGKYRFLRVEKSKESMNR